jgi:hypothetical protein
MPANDAYNEGYDAYSDGVAFSENPHNRGTDDRRSWETGWKAAKKHDDNERGNHSRESTRVTFMPASTETYEDGRSYQVGPRPDAGRFLLKTVVVCSVVGGVYGASLGSVVATNTAAAIPIGIAAAILAIVGGLFASKIGRLVGVVNRVRFARMFLTTVAAVISAIVGVFPVVLALALPWSAVGAIVGWFVGRYNARSWRRIVAEVLGALLGGCIGTIILSMQQDQTAAQLGAVLGMGIGAVVGSLTPLLFWRSLDRVFERLATDRWIRMRRRNG